MNSDKVAHLGFIQGVITRMGTTSFLIKGWTVTLVAAMFVLSAKDSNKMLALLAYFPVLMFWVIDAFFLHQEKLYRKLYEDVARGAISSDEFTLDTNPIRDKVPTIYCVGFSKTLVPFYAVIVALIVFVMLTFI
jgi:hypothetical protein